MCDATRAGASRNRMTPADRSVRIAVNPPKPRASPATAIVAIAKNVEARFGKLGKGKGELA